MLLPSRSKSFTLLELLIVIGILAVLSTALIMVIRPAEQFRKGRDSSRVSQLDSLRTALNMALMENIDLGEDHTVYLSLPSNDPSCSDLTLPPLPNLWTYHCSNSSNYRKIDGTGWIPINFTELVTVNLPALPIDPLNNTTYYFTYTTGGSYELTALLESPERHEPALNDGDAFPGLYAVGTSLNLTPRTRDLGLVGYWKMDEALWLSDCSSPTVQDSSGYGNHGKACPNGQGPVTAPGKVGNAGSFDGTDDYVDCGNDESLNITDAITIEAWIYVSGFGTPNRNYIVNKGGSSLIYSIAVDGPSPKFVGRVYTTTHNHNVIRTTATFSLNQWYHVVFTRDTTNGLRLFVNGVNEAVTVVEGVKNPSGFITISANPLEMGKYPSAGYYHNGLIDDVRIYNRALSAEEIQAIYNATK